MLIRTFAALAVICSFSNDAIAQDAPPQPPAEKKVCRAITPTGSIMSKRVCLTKTEWAKLSAESEKQNETFRNRPSGGVGPAR